MPTGSRGVAAVLIVALAWGAPPGWPRAGSGRAGRILGASRRRPRRGLAERMCDLTRYLVGSVLVAIASTPTWRPLAALILGFALAALGGLLVNGFMRGLQMPRWVRCCSRRRLRRHRARRSAAEADHRRPGPVGFDAGKHALLAADAMIQIADHRCCALRGGEARSTASSTTRSAAPRASIRRSSSSPRSWPASRSSVAAFFIGIDIVGIDLTALAVFSGAFGLAVGFGLQKTFGNLIAGIILLMDRSIKPGDVIVVGDSFGHVTKIGVRAVSIVTRDGKEHLIPNENLMTQEVENWSYSSRDVRVHIPVGVAYDCDLPLAQKLMIEAAKASEAGAEGAGADGVAAGVRRKLGRSRDPGLDQPIRKPASATSSRRSSTGSGCCSRRTGSRSRSRSATSAWWVIGAGR
jgi:hypothetical protein